MRKAAHTGEVRLDVDGAGEIPLRFKWSAISELQTAYGTEWEKEVNRICVGLDAAGMANLLAIGSDKPADWWTEKSPPFVLAAKAIQEALHLAFFGAGGMDEADPPKADVSMIQSARHGKSGSSSGRRRANSGD